MKIKNLFYRCLLIVAAIGGAAWGVDDKTLTCWRMEGFDDFVQGTFTDGGMNSYAAADGTVRLFSLWDLNGDGNFDLPVTCPQNHNEAVEASVYWGDKQGYSADRCRKLEADGAVAGAAADLNKDGWTDLILANHFDGAKTQLLSYIYWNGPAGLGTCGRTELPTVAADGVAVADLNGDGFMDIVFANAGVDYHMVVDRMGRSYIYWGSEKAYSSERRTDVATEYARDVAIADVNQDGHLDLVFANEGNTEKGSGALIYYGDGTKDFGKKRIKHLPGIHSTAVVVADLNRDEYADIVLANKHRIGEKPDPPTGERITSHRVNSYIYCGSANGYSVERRLELPTEAAACAAAGDLNGDGWSEVVFGQGESYLQRGISCTTAMMYRNRQGNFDANQAEPIEAWTAHGVMISDLDGDGGNELIFANNIRMGSMDTESFIYWSGPEGLQKGKRTELPTQGAKAAVTADFNRDGYPDVVFVNKASGLRELSPEKFTMSYVYWGDAQGGWDVRRRTELPTHHADMHLTGDFNGDGQEDLLLVNGDGPVIFLGNPAGFSLEKTLKVPVEGMMSARTADFNRDGYMDLFFNSGLILYGGPGGYVRTNSYQFSETMNFYPSIADVNRDGWIDVMYYSRAKDALVIIKNSSLGFEKAPSWELNTSHRFGMAIETADLNRDGYLDIIYGTRTDQKKPLGEGEYWLYHGNPYADSLIFWGSADGYSIRRMQTLPTVGVNDVLADDLNNDGWIDLAFPSYHAGLTRTHPGIIYWNGPEGFMATKKSEFENHSSSGVMAADTNSDGWKDLIVANHLREGKDHGSAFVKI